MSLLQGKLLHWSQQIGSSTLATCHVQWVAQVPGILTFDLFTPQGIFAANCGAYACAYSWKSLNSLLRILVRLVVGQSVVRGGAGAPPDVDVLDVFVAVLVAFVAVLGAFVAVLAVSAVFVVVLWPRPPPKTS